MKIIKLIIVLLFPLSLVAQIDYKECLVIQTNTQDTTIRHTSLIQRYDGNGNLKYEKYQDYKTDFQNGRMDGEYHYQYRDNLLIENKFVEKSRLDDEFDTTKTIFIYTDGLLTKEKTYKYTSRLKGAFRGCEPKYPQDYLPKSWLLIGDKNFYYNENRKLIEEFAPDTFNTSQNRYIYKYDEFGKLIKKLSLEGERLIWTESYVYKNNLEIMTRVWEHKGKVEVWTNPLLVRFDRYLDDKGNLMREECYYDKLEKNNVFHSLNSYEYDENNKLKKHVSLGEDMKAQIVHEYIYR